MKFLKLPVEIQNRMLYEQKLQGNLENPLVFITLLNSGKYKGGINWDETVDGDQFWREILIRNNIELFFKKYPKNVIKSEYTEMYRKKFKINNLSEHVVDIEKIKELGLEYILI